MIIPIDQCPTLQLARSLDDERAPDTVRSTAPTVPHNPIPYWYTDPNNYLDPED